MHFSYKKYLLLAITIIIIHIVFAQPTKKTVAINEGVITYSFRSNGKEMKSQPPLQLFFKNNIAHLAQGTNQAPIE